MPHLIGLLDGHPVIGLYEEVVERHESEDGHGEIRSFEGRRSFEGVLVGAYSPAVAGRVFDLEILGMGRIAVVFGEAAISRSIPFATFRSLGPPDRSDAIDPDILRLPVCEILRHVVHPGVADKVLRIAAMLGVDVDGLPITHG
jgi:hypothetical protein